MKTFHCFISNSFGISIFDAILSDMAHIISEATRLNFPKMKVKNESNISNMGFKKFLKMRAEILPTSKYPSFADFGSAK